MTRDDVRECPIIFNGAMVSAILDGRKTQTRRVAKFTDCGHLKEPRGHRRWHRDDPDAVLACPYGQPGDRLWVREAWAVPGTVARSDDPVRPTMPVIYRASASSIVGHSWRSPIHMPRWASRITLEVTDVRVERVQEISEEDAMAEGALSGIYPAVNGRALTEHEIRRVFGDLWDDIHGPGAWERNDWVWRIAFRRVDR